MVAATKKKTSLARAVFSGSLGNMLEWFDYGLYGYFAAIISADFFVADDPIVGLLLSFLVFGTGFLVRPIGGILIGAYADKHGRIKALTLTILCMGICTMLMGCLPTYSQVGLLAPILLTVLRLLQGLATGGEFGSSLTGGKETTVGYTFKSDKLYKVQEVNLFETQVPFTIMRQYYKDIKKVYGETLEINWSDDTEKNNKYAEACLNGSDKAALDALNAFLTETEGEWVSFNFEKGSTMMVVQCYKSDGKWVVKRTYMEKE